MKRDLLRLYQNYLYALREKQLYGDKYGDTDEIIKMYEKQLGKDEPLNELLGMIKDGKAPKKVKWKNHIYTYVYDDDREENIINYYCDLERYVHLIDGGQHDIRLNDEVEILEEEKKIPEKLDKYADVSGDLACEWTFGEKKLKDKINEIIDYLDYLKSKGDE